jgi:hypothetical protein
MSELMLINARARRGAKKTRKTPRKKTTRRALPALTARRRRLRRPYRRNPIKMGNLAQTFTSGAVGAAGALGVDFLATKLPLGTLATGQFKPVVKGMLGIGLGMAVAKLGRNRRMGEQLANGAVTVSLYEAGKQMFGASLGLAGDEGLLGAGLLGYDTFDGWHDPAPVSAWDANDTVDGFDTF